MCSIGEEDFGDEGGSHVMINEIPLGLKDVNDICKKCNERECVVRLDFKNAQCKNCFLDFVRHKFRATLGSSKLLPKGSEVIVVFDGSAESLVLLDMIYFATSQDLFKRLRCHPKVLYIDQYFLIDSATPIIPLIKEMLAKYNTTAYFMSLSSNKNPILFEDVQNSDIFKKEEETFKKKIESIKTLTSQQDFLSKVRYNKIVSAAEYFGCKFVFLPDITSKLATNLLNDIILGRGASAALDASLLDDRAPNVKIIRPLKDLTENEVQAYIEQNNLKALSNYISMDNHCSNYSLQNLTKLFIDNLQKNFPATVSTIFRVGDKLAPKVLTDNRNSNCIETSSSKCIFCYSHLDNFGSKTLFATEFSRLVSHKANDKLNNLDELEKLAEMHLDLTQSQVLKNLCHACRNIYNDNSGCFLT